MLCGAHFLHLEQRESPGEALEPGAEARVHDASPRPTASAAHRAEILCQPRLFFPLALLLLLLLLLVVVLVTVLPPLVAESPEALLHVLQQSQSVARLPHRIARPCREAVARQPVARAETRADTRAEASRQQLRTTTTANTTTFIPPAAADIEDGRQGTDKDEWRV